MKDLLIKYKYKNYEYFTDCLELSCELIKNVNKKDLIEVLIKLNIVNSDVTLDTSKSEYVLYFDKDITEDCTDFVIETCYNTGAGDWGCNYSVYSLDTYINKVKNTLDCLLKYKNE